MSHTTTRRSFLRQTASALGAVTAAGCFEAFLSQAAAGNARDGGYGELVPVKDESTGLELLKLPRGFRYTAFGWRGDPLADGTPTPGSHDGMAVIAAEKDHVVLCRNHERNYSGDSFGDAKITYDPQGPAGCTNLKFDTARGKLVKSWSSLAGTSRNCAGGPTPWGTWLSCEETVYGPGDVDRGVKHEFEKDHGWIFDVPAEESAQPVPLKDMGRFVHEAVAVDPASGIVYETEDRNRAGLYRFVPKQRGKLVQGGRLQMLKVAGTDPNGRDLRRGLKVGQTFDVQWVDIEDPTRAHTPKKKPDGQGVYSQGLAGGGATFARLEGCWYSETEKLIYVIATSGGDAGRGQVWQLDPRQQRLRLAFESPGAKVLDMPDNVTVSPRGGVVLCEDGKGKISRMHGLTREGKLFTLAVNNIDLRRGERKGFDKDYREQEWCGATFSPDGRWLFVNVQTPGVTFAITGPWGEGPL